jgi:hypothetical protein
MFLWQSALNDTAVLLYSYLGSLLGFQSLGVNCIGDASPPTWAVQLRRPCALAGRPVLVIYCIDVK